MDLDAALKTIRRSKFKELPQSQLHKRLSRNPASKLAPPYIVADLLGAGELTAQEVRQAWDKHDRQAAARTGAGERWLGEMPVPCRRCTDQKSSAHLGVPRPVFGLRLAFGAFFGHFWVPRGL